MIRHVIVEIKTRAPQGAHTTFLGRQLGESHLRGGDGPWSEPDARAREFEALADRNLESSYRLARVILGSREGAEDAVHDAFETAWRKWSTLRDPARFEAWFARIVVNTCRDRLRKTKRRREQDIEHVAQPVARDAFESVDEQDRMSRAFSGLEPDHRVVLALRYYRDMAVDDIADLLGVRSGTVKSRLHRAQNRLREILSADGASR